MADYPERDAEIKNLHAQVSAGVASEKESIETARRLLSEARGQLSRLRSAIETLAADMETQPPSEIAPVRGMAPIIRALLDDKKATPDGHDTTGEGWCLYPGTGYLHRHDPPPQGTDVREKAIRAVMEAAECAVTVDTGDCLSCGSAPCGPHPDQAYCGTHDWEDPWDPDVPLCPWAVRLAERVLSVAGGPEMLD